jgi:hypothetical protein
MAGERGQATVEWIGIVLLVALALAALGRFAPRAHGEELGVTIAHSVTCAARDGCGHGESASGISTASGVSSRVQRGSRPVRRGFTPPPLLPHRADVAAGLRLRLPSARTLVHGGRRQLADRVGRAGERALVERLRRGTGTAWRRAWIACLVYERFRYAFIHPESRFPGHVIPPSEVLRMANDCISPLDLVRDWPALRGR